MKTMTVLFFLAIAAAAGFWLVRPGVFTIQPIGAMPEGATVIYHSRGDQIPLFASADGLCLKLQGAVSLLCRGTAMAGALPITERIVLRLPYIEMAYLLSTDGQSFDR